MSANWYRYRETPEGFPVYKRIKGAGYIYVCFCRTRYEAMEVVYQKNGWRMPKNGNPVTREK